MAGGARGGAGRVLTCLGVRTGTSAASGCRPTARDSQRDGDKARGVGQIWLWRPSRLRALVRCGERGAQPLHRRAPKSLASVLTSAHRERYREVRRHCGGVSATMGFLRGEGRGPAHRDAGAGCTRGQDRLPGCADGHVDHSARRGNGGDGAAHGCCRRAATAPMRTRTMTGTETRSISGLGFVHSSFGAASWNMLLRSTEARAAAQMRGLAERISAIPSGSSGGNRC